MRELFVFLPWFLEPTRVKGNKVSQKMTMQVQSADDGSHLATSGNNLHGHLGGGSLESVLDVRVRRWVRKLGREAG